MFHNRHLAKIWVLTRLAMGKVNAQAATKLPRLQPQIQKIYNISLAPINWIHDLLGRETWVMMAVASGILVHPRQHTS